MDDVVGVFDAMAATYDELEPWYEHLYARVHAIVRQALPRLAPGAAASALDAGCGTGFQTALLDALGYRAHGVDLSPGLLAVAHARLPRATFVRGRLEALPYGDGSFDAVTCCGSTLSFVADPATALAELGRVLRPGGRLVLEVEHKWSAELAWMAASALTGDALGYGVTARTLWQALARPLRESCVLAYPGYGRLRLFTATELRRLLTAAGLVPTTTWGIHSVTGLMPSTVLHRPRLPGALRPVYAALCAVDGLMTRVPPARGVASSLVVLARKTT
jgi:ubiquinone/menaquinone biosynthesis C-methylase UbiE